MLDLSIDILPIPQLRQHFHLQVDIRQHFLQDKLADKNNDKVIL